MKLNKVCFSAAVIVCCVFLIGIHQYRFAAYSTVPESQTIEQDVSLLIPREPKSVVFGGDNSLKQKVDLISAERVKGDQLAANAERGTHQEVIHPVAFKDKPNLIQPDKSSQLIYGGKDKDINVRTHQQEVLGSTEKFLRKSENVKVRLMYVGTDVTCSVF